MKWFKNLRISAKLLIGFIFVALLTGVLGIFGIINLNQLNDADTVLYENMTVPISIMSEISTEFQQQRVDIRDMILAQQNDEIMAKAAKLGERDAKLNELTDKYSALILSEDIQKQVEVFRNTRVDYMLTVKDIIELARQNKDSETLVLMTDDSAGRKLAAEQAAINKLIEMTRDAAQKQADNNTAHAGNVIFTMYLIIAAAMLLSIAIGIILSSHLSRPIKRTKKMIEEMSKGHLGIRLNMNTRDEVGQMAAAMDGFAEDLQRNVVGCMKKISEGDINIEILDKDDKDEISPAMRKTILTINNLINETGNLVNTIQEGKLNSRGNTEVYSGSWKELVIGLNKLIEAFAKPIKVTADYVDRISKGDIPPKITETYYGDFNEIKINLNNCIGNISALVADADMLVDAALEGRLSTRAEAARHSGDYRKIIDGVNRTMDAVIIPISEAAAVLEEMSKGNLQTSVKGDYKGDLAKIKDALNFTVTTFYGYINEISSVLGEMTEGNLRVSIDAEYLGDFIEIKNALNKIIDSFNNVLRDMNTASEQVALGARQVSNSSQTLSQGSIEQASSIEELTATMTEIASQTKQNATNANQANELAISAKDNAIQGNMEMKEMLKSMDEINQSSSSISKIIKVIDEIAFQTNILALNAAVEAARAGQHGKGFAVVAEEVRNLAARSANAAKETTSMIEGSIRKVEGGTKIANETAAALNKIVEGVAKAANIVGEIAVASNEQAIGIQQINLGIEQVSQVIQTNSATAEESAAASEELSSQAELVKNMIMKFSLKADKTAFSRYDSINPDMSDIQSKRTFNSKNKKQRGSLFSKPRVSLSDYEFDKY